MRTALIMSFVLLICIAYGCSGHDDSSRPTLEEPVSVTVSKDYKKHDLPDCTTKPIHITEGALCGKVVETSFGKSVNAYLGIPFAESTAGDNRWRAPGTRKVLGRRLKSYRARAFVSSNYRCGSPSIRRLPQHKHLDSRRERGRAQGCDGFHIRRRLCARSELRPYV